MMKLTTTIIALALASSIAHSATYYRSTVADINLASAWLVYNGTGDPAEPTSYVSPFSRGLSPIPSQNDTVVFWNGPWTSTNSVANNIASAGTVWQWKGLEINSLTAATTTTYIVGPDNINDNVQLYLGSDGINIKSSITSGGGVQFSNSGTTSNRRISVILDEDQSWKSEYIGTGTLANAAITINNSSTFDFNGKNLTLDMARGGNIVSLVGAIVKNTTIGIPPTLTINSGTFSLGVSLGAIGVPTVVMNGSSEVGAIGTVHAAVFSYSGAGTLTDPTDFNIATEATNGSDNLIFNNRFALGGAATQVITLFGSMYGSGNAMFSLGTVPTSSLIFSNDNSNFSGTMSFNGSSGSGTGFIQIASDGAFGNSNATFQPADMNASRYTNFIPINADRTMTVGNIRLGSFRTEGDYSLTFTGVVRPDKTGISFTISNNIMGEGKMLAFTGDFEGLINEANGTRTLTFTGSGTTLISGDIYNAGTTSTGSIIPRAITADGQPAVATSALRTDGGITLAVSGVNIYTGATLATNGASLYINGDNSDATGAVSTVLGTAFPAGLTTTLGGIGTIGGATTIAAGTILRPGTAAEAGNLTFLRTLTIPADAVVSFRYESLITMDREFVTSVLNLAANWRLTLEGEEEFWLSLTESVQLFSYNPAVANSISTNAIINIDGCSVYDDKAGGIWLIPEPGALALLALGGFAIVAIRRSRRKS